MSTERRQIFESMADDFQSVYKSLLKQKQAHLNDVPYGQRTALFNIALHERLQIKQLAELLQITSGAATQHAEALVQSGYIERMQDPSDRRVVHLTLSKEGKKRLHKLKKQRMERMMELFADVGDDELQEFVKTIKKIHTTLRAKGEDND